MEKYTTNYLSYIELTKDIDMSVQYKLFMKYVPIGSKILDAGFGSGRDIKFFIEDYDVTGIDLSEEFVNYVKENIHSNVYQMDILDIVFEDEFDAIWSCASQVHFDSNKFLTSFDSYHGALKEAGILYVSLKKENDDIVLDKERIPITELIKRISDKYVVLESEVSFSQDNNQEWYSLVLMSY